MNRKLKRLFVIGSVACCLSAVPALSYEHGGDTRATAARESHSNSLGSWGASRKPAETRPANMGEIDNHAIDIYEKEMRHALSITDRPSQDAAVTSAREQLAQNIRKPLTAGTIEELDGLLDLGGLSPELGATAS